MVGVMATPGNMTSHHGGPKDSVRIPPSILPQLGCGGESEFVPSEFTFQTGQTVNFEMTAEVEYHTFTIRGLGIDENIEAGEVVEFLHTFDRPGRYELICIPHLAFNMTGVIVVK